MVHLTFGGQEIIAQPDPQQPALEHAVEIKQYRHIPEFFFHYHPYYELCFRTGTKGERLVGNSIEPYNETEMVLLGPNLPHPRASQPDTHGNVVKNYIIHFSLESLGVEMLSKPEFRHIRRMLDLSQQGICFTEDHINATADRIAELPKLSLSQRFLSLVGILDAFMEPKNVISRAVRYQFNRDEIAAHIGLSVSTFSRFFKRMTGKTLVSYMNELKIRRATELLINSNDSIFDISFAVGYQNCSYFNKQFKTIIGMTPGEYRFLKSQKI